MIASPGAADSPFSAIGHFIWRSLCLAVPLIPTQKNAKEKGQDVQRARARAECQRFVHIAALRAPSKWQLEQWKYRGYGEA